MCILNLILSMLFEGLAFLPIPRALDRAACSLRSCCEHSQAAGFGDRYFGHNKDRQTSVDHILQGAVLMEHFGDLCMIWWVCIPLAACWCCGCVGVCGPAAQVPGSEVAAESAQCFLNPPMIKVSWISIG